MKTWNECCKEVGFDPRDSAPPITIYQWFAYKAGVAYECVDEVSAKSLSKNYERVQTKASKEVVDAYWVKRTELKEKATAVWEATLNKEFDNIPLKIFELCYNRAYEDAHSEGYDSVYYKMDSYVEFAEEIMKEYK